MTTATITLHPSMTVQQMAEWCAEHNQVLTIEGVPTPDGRTQLVAYARPLAADDSIPSFLRRQAL